MRYEPHNYQKHCIKEGISKACVGFLLDPGLGKTSTIYAIFKILRQRGIVRRMLVIAPLRPAYSVWPGEAAKWDDFHDIKVGVLHGPNKDAVLKDPTVDVHVINPEGLKWLFDQPIEEWWEILVVDESTRFKHANTQRFKLLKPKLPRFRRRYVLTGSPAPNGLLDLFGQIYILDLGNALGRFITHYRNTYFDPSGYGGYTWLPREGSAERIQDQIRPLTVRMAAEDYLELPPLITNTLYVDLPDDAMEVYKQMEALLIAEVQNGVITAANAAAATGKCRQIANGGIYHEDGEEFTNLHEAKVDAVEEIVEELSGKPALVAYEYKHDLNRLLERFGGDTPYIGGGVTPKRFRQIETDWNAGVVPLLFAQPQSVAHGLNLQGTGAAVIFHSLTWNLEDYEQFIRRVWRQGQKERVFLHHVVAADTIDETVMSVIKSKDRTQRALLAALKDYGRGR